MATFERPSRATASTSTSVPSLPPFSAPSPFPQDELIALRNERPQNGPLPSPSLDGHLPPGYDDDHETDPFLDPHHPYHPHHNLSSNSPPLYPYQERTSFEDHNDYPQDKPSSSATQQQLALSSDKMQADLDNVTAAISRLYTVAPQLGDQRVELNERKRDEMDLARMVGRGKMTDQVAESKGKARETREQELGQIWERIEQAHGRRLNDQEADMLSSGPSASAKRERDQKKQAFMEDVADRTSAGRMHGQDSSPPSLAAGSTVKEQQDLITVGQFIRELGSNSITPSSSNRHPSVSSKSPTPSNPSLPTPGDSPTIPSSSRRSSFVPAFVGALQRRSSIKNGPSEDSLADVGTPSSPSTSTSTCQTGYRFVAKLQESIQVVQVHLEVDLPAGTSVDIVAVKGQEDGVRITSSKENWDVWIPLPGMIFPHSSSASTVTDLSSSAATSSILSFRLSASPFMSPSSSLCFHSLSAPDLAALAPTFLACATCHTPVILTSTLSNPSKAYKDLPSEHWEELVGSWLCHDEMKLALGVEEERGGKAAGGIWPRKGEVLVGGNYVLVGEGLVAGDGVWRVRAGSETETWQPIDCSTCSSPLGRRFHHPSVPPTSTFKFPKYAVVPVTAGDSSPSSTHPLPLSIFIASDLLELADVHRCYHFVIHAEEDPLVPLILIWLINPSIHITTSSSPTPFRAAKVMFSTALDYNSTLPPAFDAAEELFYPSSVCSKLAAELEEGHGEYPGTSGAGMMGLKGSWLRRW